MTEQEQAFLEFIKEKYIADVNEDKFGCFTPGPHIPIISEKEAKAMEPDYYFVLPYQRIQLMISAFV